MPPEPGQSPSAPRVLLIGWDAADWRMIDPLLERGLMPNLERFLAGGVRGNIASLRPMLSPLLWTSIATGKFADKHGILGFAEPDGDTGRVRPVTSTSRTCKAVWNIASDHGLRAGVVNWYATHPAEPIHGFVASDRFAPASGKSAADWPVPERSVHPAPIAGELAPHRVHPRDTTAAQIAAFIPRLAEGGLAEDRRVAELRILLAHCATVHAAATHLMQSRPWDLLAVYYDAIDRIGHEFMEFHPPRMPHLAEADFANFSGVMDACYRFHDLMLGRLLELAGPDTTVILVSDHGFHHGDRRPEGSGAIREGRPLAWHRPYGVFAARGPGIRRGESVYGASLLDLAPTVLALLGLPVGEDMDGKPLIQIADPPLSVRRVPTHEVPGGPVSDEPASDPWTAAAAIDQLVQLGYLESTGVDDIVVDRHRNLGQVYESTGRPGKAIEEYKAVLARRPDDGAARLAVASCLLSLGRLDECEGMVRDALKEDPGGPRANLFMGMISFRRGRPEEALTHLREAERADGRMPGVHGQIGVVLLNRRMWAEAQRSFERALEIDADDAEAWDGLGVAYRAQGLPKDAVLAHMRSAALQHYRPSTHIHLGLALAEAGNVRWAAEAFRVAIGMEPGNVRARAMLADLLERGLNDPVGAAEVRGAQKQ